MGGQSRNVDVVRAEILGAVDELRRAAVADGDDARLSVARQLSGSTGTPWQAKAISPWGRSGALKEIRSAAARRAVPVYVGSRWIPRHVVLVLDAGLRVYEPSSGRVVTITADDFVKASLSLAGWSNPWFSVLPARRTPA